MYEQLFDIIPHLTPERSTDFSSNAVFKIEKTIALSTNTWDRVERMEVMFWFNGVDWVFYDPSFDKALGRKLATGIK